MRYFSVEYEWRTRPMFRKGRLKKMRVAVAAEDVAQLYDVAKAEGARRFPRRKWQVLGYEELTAPNAKAVA